jgi:3-dehydroquinate synthase
VTIDISLKPMTDNSYKIFIDELGPMHFDKKVAIITNPKVSGLHLGKLLENLRAREVYIITVPDGEEHKNMTTVEYVLERLFEHTFDRKSLLIAFGGGVIGDMTGFIASLYQRGIDFIQIPTTLLSQVDASVGGKTGVNNRFGKNLIGAFYQPKSVHIDTRFLDTLPIREFGAGVAEIIKMAVMFDREFYAFLQQSDLKNDRASLEKAILRSVELKAHVVSKDEKEQGIRAVLNYGHTFAHVIEQETKYARFLHGEAVAIGMVMANELAKKTGLISDEQADGVKALLEHYALPTNYAVVDVDAFYAMFFLDKKSANDAITFILPDGIGAFQMRADIAEETVKSVLAGFSFAGGFH